MRGFEGAVRRDEPVHCDREELAGERAARMPGSVILAVGDWRIKWYERLSALGIAE